MARKVIIDCDPGIDDAIALAIALFDPRLEVVGITACAGTVDAHQVTSNVHTLVEKMDPPKMPRIGTALDEEAGVAVSNRTEIHGKDGLGGYGGNPVSRQHTLPSDKLISDRLRSEGGAITLLCLGPLTNLAKAFSRDPGLTNLLDRIVIAGGCTDGIGDETPAAEFNMHFDPASAKAIFNSPTTKSLIPLEIGGLFDFGLELIDHLPASYTRVGEVLQNTVPHWVRSSRQKLGHESVSLHSALAVLSLVEPMLFEWEEMAGNVEVTGELTRGATIFDRRSPRAWRPNMEVATGFDVSAARDAFYNSLRFAGQNS
ncbi:MAG TPA: nucleoside hydrolase [Planctomycetaceae bacterium]|nr:nucleoside hydrolase [Planctomycetaceae bacterium]